MLAERHGFERVEFGGFMVDSAQAIFTPIREIFGSRDKAISMVGKEQTYQFDWLVALDQHTKQHIKPEL